MWSLNAPIHYHSRPLILFLNSFVFFGFQTNGVGVKSDASSTWNILRDDFMMGAKMKDWNREEQTTKKKDKKLTNITDLELENTNPDFGDESDDTDFEDSDSN